MSLKKLIINAKNIIRIFFIKKFSYYILMVTFLVNNLVINFTLIYEISYFMKIWRNYKLNLVITLY